MGKLKTLFFLVFLAGFFSKVSAQSITVDESLTIDQLVNDILINNPCITVSNVSFTGLAIGSGSSVGHFTDGGSSFPFEEGVILSTGLVQSAVGPNNSIISDGNSSWGGDSDLEDTLSAVGINSSVNASVLEFDFLPLANKISFDYMFSSEQYLSSPSANQCNFTDGFVFLLKKANTTEPYKNLAVIPNTNIPVTVKTIRGSGTVCTAANEAYFGGFNGLNHPTNFNGQTVVLTAESDVEPGTLYHIKLVVADVGNSLYDSAIFLGKDSFKIEKNLGDDRLLTTENPLCVNETLTLDATENAASVSYAWYRNGILQPETTPTFVVNQPGVYESEATINSGACKIRGSIEVEYSTLSINQAQIVQCDDDNDGVTVFNLNKAQSQITSDPNISLDGFYENSTDPQPLSNPENYASTVPKTVYAKMTNQFGCSAFTDVILTIANNSIPTPTPFEICDEDPNKDGLYEFDLDTQVSPVLLQGLPTGLQVAYYLNAADAISETNPLTNPFENTVPFAQTIYARIVNGTDCFGITPVDLVVNALIIPDFGNSEVPLCENSNVDLSVPSGFTSYLWNDPNNSTTSTITVTTPGNYSVVITDSNGCTNSKTFTVTLSGKATITGVDINDFQGNSNTVTINYTGVGVYEFSLDGSNFQSSPTFSDVAAGKYTVYVNDTKKCGLTTDTIYVLDYPVFFTPNNDGYNDLWRIPFLYLFPKSEVRIFDRYGKLMTAFSGRSQGWDGKLNGQPLPASDYWFVILMENGRMVKGHFALKR